MRKHIRFAGLWPRFFALFVDFLLFFTVFFPITRMVKGVWIMNATDHRWHSGLIITDPMCITFLVVMGLYFVLLEGLAGITLGKWIFGLRVERIEGGKPGLTRGLFRNVLRVVDGLPALNILGIVLIVASKEHARFGDRIAGTRVIRMRKNKVDNIAGKD
ncbi:MAG: RDD family protein [Acidobacteria bacterium]|nr:RDD family protein [Acidobacteriota bacterium]